MPSAVPAHLERGVNKRSTDGERYAADHQSLHEDAQAFARGAGEHVIERADTEDAGAQAGRNQDQEADHQQGDGKRAPAGRTRR